MELAELYLQGLEQAGQPLLWLNVVPHCGIGWLCLGSVLPRFEWSREAVPLLQRRPLRLQLNGFSLC